MGHDAQIVLRLWSLRSDAIPSLESSRRILERISGVHRLMASPFWSPPRSACMRHAVEHVLNFEHGCCVGERDAWSSRLLSS